MNKVIDANTIFLYPLLFTAKFWGGYFGNIEAIVFITSTLTKLCKFLVHLMIGAFVFLSKVLTMHSTTLLIDISRPWSHLVQIIKVLLCCVATIVFWADFIGRYVTSVLHFSLLKKCVDRLMKAMESHTL